MYTPEPLILVTKESSSEERFYKGNLSLRWFIDIFSLEDTQNESLVVPRGNDALPIGI